MLMLMMSWSQFSMCMHLHKVSVPGSTYSIPSLILICRLRFYGQEGSSGKWGWKMEMGRRLRELREGESKKCDLKLLAWFSFVLVFWILALDQRPKTKLITDFH